MHLLCWLHLPLLMLLHLSLLASTVQIRHAETLLACESTLCSNRQHSDWIERCPCRTRGVGSLRITQAVDGSNDVPTTLTPVQSADDKNATWEGKLPAIAGGAGAILLVIVISAIAYLRIKKLAARSSERESSTQSRIVAGLETQFIRLLRADELKLATRNFSEGNLIGEGLFGLAYKGLLLDGSIAVIKRNICHPIQNFAYEVRQIAAVQNQHLVKLIGYCDDKNQQFLVSEFISNGNVGQYLYDSEGLPVGKLGIKRRLSIALGAAKGLRYLHSLVPPLLHTHFRTSNVLVDENFTAKVSDYGVHKLVAEAQHPGSSSPPPPPTTTVDYFLDPEVNSSGEFSELSDVYSYGVFLLELISGRDVHSKCESKSEPNLLMQARVSRGSDLVDKSLQGKDRTKRIMMDLALMCVDVSARRPSMANVVKALEWIRERETGHVDHGYGDEEIGGVKLGSELFKC